MYRWPCVPVSCPVFARVYELAVETIRETRYNEIIRIPGGVNLEVSSMVYLRRMICGLCVVAALAMLAVSYVEAASPKKHLLVVSVTAGFRHSSIELGEKTIAELGEKNGKWDVDYVRTNEDMARMMTASALKKYDAVVFNNTSGDLPLPDRQALLDFVRNGKAYVGIHAATDSFRDQGDKPGWKEYNRMVGAQFVTHGAQSDVTCIVEDRNHPATRHLPAQWTLREEVYQFKDFSRDRMHGLLSLDKHPNTREPGDYPIAWCRNEEKGRVFYTALGHREDLMQTDLYRRHLEGGILWAIGLEKGSGEPIKPQPVTPAEKKQGFRVLFDGVSTKGWHARNDGRTTWTAQNGMLVMGHGGADLISDRQFRNFVIRYEYQVPKGGNSGLYLRGRYEVQVLDDYDSKMVSLHGNGSVYGAIAPGLFASRPAGEWQTVEATMIGNRITVILNGIKIVDDQPVTSVTGGALDGNMDVPGPIMLQGDHGPIAYRNIRVKPLPGR